MASQGSIFRTILSSPLAPPPSPPLPPSLPPHIVQPAPAIQQRSAWLSLASRPPTRRTTRACQLCATCSGEKAWEIHSFWACSSDNFDVGCRNVSNAAACMIAARRSRASRFMSKFERKFLTWPRYAAAAGWALICQLPPPGQAPARRKAAAHQTGGSRSQSGQVLRAV